MKTDVNGTSTCPVGEERFEEFHANGKKYLQYDYRHPSGELFSCICPTLQKCREARDLWMVDRKEQ